MTQVNYDIKNRLSSLPVNCLVGDIDDILNSNVLPPFSDFVIDFLSILSSDILSDQQNRNFPDVITFAYWCRRANLKRLKENYQQDGLRIGLGLTFHIAPSNVPVNFAFSFVFSLLAGNSNIVRVPSREFSQVNILLDKIKNLLRKPEFAIIKEKSLFVKYEQNDVITSYFSSLCDVRVIWGGDNTIQHIRSIPIPPRSIDVAFADRFSLCIIDTAYLENISKAELDRLCLGFYNDTYLMDQNACSSPQIVIWKHESNYSNAEKLINEFWSKLSQVAERKYSIQPIQAIDKLTRVFRDSIDKSDSLERISLYNGTTLIKASLFDLDEGNENYKASFGYFYEYKTDSIETIKHLIDKKVQTITFIGNIETEIASMVIENGLKGIDRIVPVGTALDIDILWDGFDLIRTLSRIINIKK